MGFHLRLFNSDRQGPRVISHAKRRPWTKMIGQNSVTWPTWFILVNSSGFQKQNGTDEFSLACFPDWNRVETAQCAQCTSPVPVSLELEIVVSFPCCRAFPRLAYPHRLTRQANAHESAEVTHTTGHRLQESVRCWHWAATAPRCRARARSGARATTA